MPNKKKNESKNYLWIKIDYVNKTEGHRAGADDWYETSTTTTAELFRAMQKQFGKCVSKVHVDLKAGGSRQVGWCFEKREKYEDCKETFLREVWVEVSRTPVITRTIVEGITHAF